MNNIEKVQSIGDKLREDFEAIAMPKSKYVLEHLIVRAQDHPAQVWLQCVLEMRTRYFALKRLYIRQQVITIELTKLEGLEAKLKAVDAEEIEYQILATLREFLALYEIYEALGKRYTREEIEAAQAAYYERMLTRKANQEMMSSGGRLSPGMIEALRQIGIETKLKELPNGKG